MFTVTYFPHKTQTETKHFYTFETMNDFAHHPITSLKQHDYKNNTAIIIRGRTDGTKIKGSLSTSNILVIDADGGYNLDNPVSIAGKTSIPSPPFATISDYLVSIDINHFGYVTHSHDGNNKIKYRIFIELDDDIEEHELRANIDNLFEVIDNATNPANANIARGVEHYKWIQAWYLPSRKDPEDNLYEARYHSAGHSFKAIHVTEEYSAELEKNAPQSSVNNKQVAWLDNVMDAKELLLHDSLIKLTQAFHHGGFNDEFINRVSSILLENTTTTNPDRIKRVDEEILDLDRTIQHAKDNIFEPAIDIDYSKYMPNETTAIPYPTAPGRFGRLIEQIYAAHFKPSHTIATVSAFGVVSVLCACKVNVKMKTGSMGGALALTLMGTSGCGKSQITKFFNYVFMHKCGGKVGLLTNIAGFLGANDYTSVVGIVDDMKEDRAMLWPQAEAGETMYSPVGDKTGLNGWFMETYGENYLNGQSFSKKMSGVYLASIQDPGIVQVVISTAEKFEKHLRKGGAIENGYLPRHLVFRVFTNPKHAEVTDEELESDDSMYEFPLEEDIIKMLNELVSDATKIQDLVKVTLTDVHMLKISAKWYNDIFRIQSELEAIADSQHVPFASRYGINIIKIALIVTRFNAEIGNPPTELTEESLVYAMKFVDIHYKNIDNSISNVMATNPYDEVIIIIKKCIVQAIRKSTAKDRAEHIAIMSNINDKAKRSKPLQELAAMLRKGTVELTRSVVNDLVNRGQLNIVKKQGTDIKKVQLTQQFEE